MSALQAWLQENCGPQARFVFEKCIHGSGSPSCDLLAEPPKRVSQYSGNKPEYIGFLNVMNHLLNNVVVTIPVKVVRTGPDRFVYEIGGFKVNNNRMVATHDLDKGLSCACTFGVHNRSCSMYDICQRRCSHTRDHSGAGLPILQELDHERLVENTNAIVKRNIDATRAMRSEETQNMDIMYRHLLGRITFIVLQLISSQRLSMDRLKLWLYALQPKLHTRITETNPGVKKILNEFYPLWWDTGRLHKLIQKIEHYTEPLSVADDLNRFECEVDRYFNGRIVLDGVRENSELIALLSLDPEWHNYPARDLHQLYTRACEALMRGQGERFNVYFCTLLKEYMILKYVESFIREIENRVKESYTCSSCDRYDIPFPVGTQEVGCIDPCKFVSGIHLPKFTAPEIKSYGCGCSLLNLAVAHERIPVMPETIKHFSYLSP